MKSVSSLDLQDWDAPFRFYAELNDFLSPERKQTEFIHWLNEPASIKDAIESLGVPHPEVDLILVNGESVGFDYWTQNSDRVSVYPYFKALEIGGTSLVRPAPLPQAKFVLSTGTSVQADESDA